MNYKKLFALFEVHELIIKFEKDKTYRTSYWN